MVYTSPVNDPGLPVKHTLPSVPLFTVSYPFCMQCGGLHIPSVWPQPSGSNTLPSVPLSLILTLLHAVWWSTHPQCMTPAFGIKRISVCISVPCLLPSCMQCGGLHIPRVWPRPSGLYLCSSPLCLAICSNVMTLKITPRLWLTDN